MIADQEDLIVDRYKGMEICIRAYLGDYGTWSCCIHICTASQCDRETLKTTASITPGSLTCSAAMAMAFIEALGLCDSLLENELPVETAASSMA